jgi:voltage-gated potassium channel
MKIKTTRLRIAEILDPSHADDSLSKGFNIFIMVLIFFNAIAVIFESVNNIANTFSSFFNWFEVFSVTIFSIEYLLRLWVCTENSNFIGLKGRFKYVFSPMSLIDLFAILPFYLPMVIPFDLRFLRILRLIRIFRILKLAKYLESLQLLEKVLANKKEELIITFSAAIILLVLVSSMIYFIENNAQPGAFSSIPAAMWWSIGATTRLGAGPINPITNFGMIFGSIVAMLGLGIFALPAGILASGLIEEIHKKKSDSASCPKCGTRLN